MYEQIEKGDINNVLDLFEEDELINHITYIISSELDVLDTKKAIDDILNKLKKEKVINRKSQILKKLSSGDISKEELVKLEEELKSLSKRIAK